MKKDDALNERFRSGRAAWNIDVYRDDLVDAFEDVVRVKVDSATYGAGAHGDAPFGCRHLLPDLFESSCHLSCDGAFDYKEVRLSKRSDGLEDSEAFDVVSRAVGGSKFGAAAGYGNMCGPEGVESAPVDEVSRGFELGDFDHDVAEFADEGFSDARECLGHGFTLVLAWRFGGLVRIYV